HVDVIVGMDRCFASEWRASQLAATVRDHLIHIHVELSATARHPNMQWEHVVMLTGQDFIADLNNQFITLIIESFSGMVRGSGCLLQGGIGRNHFARNQIAADAEMLKRTLSLSTPKFVCRNLNYTETVAFFSHVCHRILLSSIRFVKNERYFG